MNGNEIKWSMMVSVFVTHTFRSMTWIFRVGAWSQVNAITTHFFGFRIVQNCLKIKCPLRSKKKKKKTKNSSSSRNMTIKSTTTTYPIKGVRYCLFNEENLYRYFSSGHSSTCPAPFLPVQYFCWCMSRSSFVLKRSRHTQQQYL